MLDDSDFIKLNEFLAARFAGAEWGHLVEACAALRYGFVLTPQECFSCPIYRPQGGHCLGAEMKDGRYVVCDYQRPR